MKAKMISLLLACILCYATTFAQLTQTIRGTVTDQLLQTPLAGATVIITGACSVLLIYKIFLISNKW